MKSKSGRLWFIAGSSQSGKTHFVRERVKTRRQFIAWDPKREWSQLPRVRSVNVSQLRALAHRGALNARLAVVPAAGNAADQFEVFAAVAWIVARTISKATIIGDELANVTSAGKARVNWHRVLSQSLWMGPEIFALTQRAAESDKTSLGNCSDVVAFRQSFHDDAAYMARALRATRNEIDALPEYAYLHRNLRTGKIDQVIPRKKRARRPM